MTSHLMGQSKSQPEDVAAVAAMLRIADPRYLEIAVSKSVNDGADEIYLEEDKSIRVVQASEKDTRVEVRDSGEWYEGQSWKRYVPVGDLDLTRPVYALYKTSRVIPRGMAGNAAYKFVSFSNTMPAAESSSRVSGGPGVFAATFDRGQAILTYNFDSGVQALVKAS